MPHRIEITDEEYADRRGRSRGSKYDALSQEMEVGQCLKIDPKAHSTSYIAVALRAYVTRTGMKNARVRVSKTFGDDYHRICLVPAKPNVMASMVSPAKPAKVGVSRRISNIGLAK